MSFTGLIGRLTTLLKRMPECGDVRMKASDYVDGDLEKAHLDRMRAHLGGCEACRAFVDTLVETIRLLGSMNREEPAPAGLKDAIRGRIAEERRLHA